MCQDPAADGSQNVGHSTLCGRVWGWRGVLWSTLLSVHLSRFAPTPNPGLPFPHPSLRDLLSSTSRSLVLQSQLAVSALENDPAAPHYHSDIWGKKLWLVCISLNQHHKTRKIESYMQVFGRAGRNGSLAHFILLARRLLLFTAGTGIVKMVIHR